MPTSFVPAAHLIFWTGNEPRHEADGAGVLEVHGLRAALVLAPRAALK